MTSHSDLLHDHDLNDKIRRLENENKAANELAQTLTETLEIQALKFESRLSETTYQLREADMKFTHLLENIKMRYPDIALDEIIESSTSKQVMVQHDEINGDKITPESDHDDKSGSHTIQDENRQLRLQLHHLVETNSRLSGELQQSEMKLFEINEQHQKEMNEMRQIINTEFRTEYGLSEQKYKDEINTVLDKLRQSDEIQSDQIQTQLRDQIATLIAERDQVQVQVQAALAHCAQIRLERDQAQAQLQHAHHDTQEQTRSHAAIMNNLLCECEQARARLETIRSEHDAILAQLQQRLQAGSEMLNQSRQQIETDHQQLQEAQRQIDSLTQTNLTLADQVNTLERLVADLSQSLQQSNQRLRDLEQARRRESQLVEESSLKRQQEQKNTIKSAQLELESALKSLHDEQIRSKHVSDQLSVVLCDKIALVSCSSGCVHGVSGTGPQDAPHPSFPVRRY